MIVIGGSSSVGLARDVADILGCEFIQASTTRFPDGECYTRIERESIEGDAVIIQNTYPDGNLVEMLLISDAATSLGAKRIVMVVPYFGYARQDKQFKPGEPMSARVMCGILDRICDKVITIDLHKESTLDNFSHDHVDLKAAEPISEYFKDKGIDMVLSPDVGASARAKDVGDRLGVPYDHLEKTRISGTEVRIKPANADCTGKNILIVDDMISTGGTIVTATRQLKEAGAKTVTVACTHGVFVNNALDRLEGSNIDNVLSANTLVSKVSKISVAKIIARALREW